MTKASHPVSLRLAMRDIEQLKTRARRVSGTLTGIVRELIVTGLAGGDNKALARRSRAWRVMSTTRVSASRPWRATCALS